MENHELRQAFRAEKFDISFVSHATSIDGQHLREFINGNDHAMTDAERQSLAQFFFPSETAQWHNAATNIAIIDGMGHALQRYSVAFFLQNRKDRPELASGTLVRIGDSIFVATAGHVIYETHMLQFVGSNTGMFQCEVDPKKGFSNIRGGSNVSVVGGKRHKVYDVGFFRLDENAPAQLGREPLDLSRISVRIPQYGRTAFVFGYPRQFVTMQPRTKGSINLPIGSITYPQPILAPNEWPETPTDSTTADERVDCFVRYSRSDEMIRIVPTQSSRGPLPPDLPHGLPEAEGMSGGGLWQSCDSHNGMWNPDSYQLIAIQSSWHERKEYLRAIQVRHWLDLVASECPELRSRITDRMETE